MNWCDISNVGLFEKVLEVLISLTKNRSKKVNEIGGKKKYIKKSGSLHVFSGFLIHIDSSSI